MKKLLKYALALTLVTTVFTSCDNRPKDSEIEGRFIDVELEGAEDGTKIQLFSFQEGKEVLIDSTVVKEGEFRL